MRKTTFHGTNLVNANLEYCNLLGANFGSLVNESHTRDILSVAITPNGKYIISGSRDYSIKIWNTQSWQI